MRMNPAISSCVLIAITASMPSYSQSAPPSPEQNQTKDKTKPIKISLYPKASSVAGLHELPHSNLVVRVEIDPDGQVTKYERVSGYEGTSITLEPFVSRIKFGASQSECSGPWIADLEISVRFWSVRGRRSTNVATKIISVTCTNNSHKCPYSS